LGGPRSVGKKGGTPRTENRLDDAWNSSTAVNRGQPARISIGQQLQQNTVETVNMTDAAPMPRASVNRATAAFGDQIGGVPIEMEANLLFELLFHPVSAQQAMPPVRHKATPPSM